MSGPQLSFITDRRTAHQRFGLAEPVIALEIIESLSAVSKKEKPISGAK
jgi:hypothetical protein